MNSFKAHIDLKDVCLDYELYNDKTNNFKEAIINLFRQRDAMQIGTEYIHALKNISLHIEEGERVGIIGRNGSGKSTLLKVVSGILKPTSGQVMVKGAVQPLIEIGAGFNPEFTGRENMYLNGYMLGFTKQQIKEKEIEMVSFAELERFIDTPIKYYSSGMSVKLAFTIATMINPEILIFDEMLAAGDVHFISKAKTRIEALMNCAKIILIVSHDLDFVRQSCRRTIWLKNGQIAFDGPSEQAIAAYLSES